MAGMAGRQQPPPPLPDSGDTAVQNATVADIELFAAHRAKHLKIKAAGGISSLEDAEAMMKAGAERLGTSRIVRIAKNQSTPAGTY